VVLAGGSRADRAQHPAYHLSIFCGRSRRTMSWTPCARY
jgi:hypothetical protein